MPVYNEASTLRQNIGLIEKAVSQIADSYEIIIAEDGSSDETEKIAVDMSKNCSKVVHLHSDHRLGKGLALKKSLKTSKGRVIVFMDADLSTSLDHLHDVVKLVENGYDIVIGSRLVEGAYVRRTLLRGVASRLYNLLVKLLFWDDVSDHQCGFKGFNHQALKGVIDEVTENGFLFDTELIVRMKGKGLRLIELPVKWAEPRGRISKFGLLADGLMMGLELVKLRFKLLDQRNRKSAPAWGAGRKMKAQIRKPEKIIVLGLGVIGFSMAKYLKQFKRFDVYGFDISLEAVQRASLHGIKSTRSWEKLPAADVYIICVSTNLKGEQPDMEQIFDVGEKIKHHIGDNDPMVLVESTVLPGTCRRLHDNLNKAASLVHVPHRYWSVDPVNYGVKQRRILGAIDEASQIRGVAFYSSIGIPVRVVSNIETAEMTKIVENAYRFVEIAFAEELRTICKRNGIKFEELRKACNTLVRNSGKEDWRVQVLEARDGIKGHCLPKDVRYLLSLGPDSEVLRNAIVFDEFYKTNFKSRNRKTREM